MPTEEVAEVEAKIPWPRSRHIVLGFDILALTEAKILASARGCGRGQTFGIRKPCYD